MPSGLRTIHATQPGAADHRRRPNGPCVAPVRAALPGAGRGRPVAPKPSPRRGAIRLRSNGDVMTDPDVSDVGGPRARQADAKGSTGYIGRIAAFL